VLPVLAEQGHTREEEQVDDDRRDHRDYQRVFRNHAVAQDRRIVKRRIEARYR